MELFFGQVVQKSIESTQSHYRKSIGYIIGVPEAKVFFSFYCRKQLIHTSFRVFHVGSL